MTASVLDPVSDSAGTGFASIGVNFVMHCVPGSFADKGAALTHPGRGLAEGGALFELTTVSASLTLEGGWIFGASPTNGLLTP
ncbi:hypothetical protein [Nocardia acidivorans]|uniref:hypothetical protein n=1 Tax=Nocardia acidivorans TaxID=404580 RepID=UPI000AE438CA|nr:hypothetical protein [Nocardia acidivorans]